MWIVTMHNHYRVGSAIDHPTNAVRKYARFSAGFDFFWDAATGAAVTGGFDFELINGRTFCVLLM
jgi:hypothetical protein